MSRPRLSFLLFLLSLSASVTAFSASSASQARPAPPPRVNEAQRTDEAQRIVADILTADYRCDLEGLAGGAAALAQLVDDRELGPAARYWRGFAQSCSALGRVFVLASERELALSELDEAIETLLSVSGEPWRSEARSLASGCLNNRIFLRHLQGDEAEEVRRQARALMAEAVAGAPESPRVLWILGGQFSLEPETGGGGRGRALEVYERGLELVRRPSSETVHPLAPRWGEAELLSALSFLHATLEPVDLARAESFARQALELQPEWKYVRERLLPGILSRSRPK